MIKGIRVDDFTGGLNLDSNAFRLAPNETNDALNVDFSVESGISSRHGFIRSNTTALDGASAGNLKPLRLFSWDNSSRRLVIATETEVLTYPSVTNGYAAADNTGINTDATYGAGFTTWDQDSTSTLYVSCGHGNNCSKIDGTTVTTLTASGTGAWQNDLTNPNGTHMPRAQLIATHVERVWVANTYENAVGYPNRLRFSHPLFPESWREDDYIDIVAGGPRINAIVPFGGNLVVFKDKAIFAVYGFNEETFQVVEISRHLGAVSTNCVVSAPNGIYFYSNPDGVFFFNGTEIKDVFGNLRPMLSGSSEITEGAVPSMSMGFANNRLYLSLPKGNDTVNILTYDSSVEEYEEDMRKYDGFTKAAYPTVTFVYDPLLGKGSWTVYRTADGFGLVSPIDFLRNDGDIEHMAVHPYQPYLLNIDKKDNGSADNITGSVTAFTSYYATNWQDAKSVSSKKFWRRPEFVFRKDIASATLTVDVYHDWDAYTPIKTFSSSAPSGTVDGNDDEWGPPKLGATHIYADALGLARAVRMKISSTTNQPWSIYSIVYKFNPRKMKF
jgi:hypothetical protein